MRRLGLLLLTFAMLIAFSFVPRISAAESGDDYLSWGEVRTAVYKELHSYTLNWTGDVLDKGGMSLSDLRITDDGTKADIVINQYGAIGAKGLLKLNERLEERTPRYRQGFLSSYTIAAGDVYLVVLHDGAYAKLRIDRILPTEVHFSYVFEGDSSSAAPTPTQVPKPTPAPAPIQVNITLVLDNQTAVVNGKDYILEKAPLIINGTTLVPVRFVTEALGATVEWNGAEQKVTLRHRGHLVELWINNPYARVDGSTVRLELAPALLDGVTLVPIRFVTESVGFQVGYDHETRKISLSGIHDDRVEGDNSGTVEQWLDLMIGTWAIRLGEYDWIEDDADDLIGISDNGTYILNRKYEKRKKGVWREAAVGEIRGYERAIILIGAEYQTDWAMAFDGDGNVVLLTSYLESPGGLYHAPTIGWLPASYELDKVSDSPDDAGTAVLNDYDYSIFTGDWELFIERGATPYYYEDTGGYATHEFTPTTGQGTLSVREDGTYVMSDSSGTASGRWRPAEPGEVYGYDVAIILEDGLGGNDWTMLLKPNGEFMVAYDSGGRWTNGSVMWIPYYKASSRV